MLYANLMNELVTGIKADIESGDKEPALNSVALLEAYTEKHAFEHGYITDCIQSIAQRAKLTDAEAMQLLIMNGIQHCARPLVTGMDLNFYLKHEEKQALAFVVPRLTDVNITAQELTEMARYCNRGGRE